MTIYYFQKRVNFLKPKLAQQFNTINNKWASTTTTFISIWLLRNAPEEVIFLQQKRTFSCA